MRGHLEQNLLLTGEEETTSPPSTLLLSSIGSEFFRQQQEDLENDNSGKLCCRLRGALVTAMACFHAQKSKAPPLRISIPIRSVAATLTGGPFAFTMIDKDIAEFLVQRAWDAVLNRQQIVFVFQTLEHGDLDRKQELQLAVRNSFQFSFTMAHFEALRAGSEGWWSALIAMIIYIICLAFIFPLAKAYNITAGEQSLHMISDIFVIVLWVVVWHPVEILVFSRLMIRRKRLVCHTLQDSNVLLEVLHVYKPPDLA